MLLLRALVHVLEVVRKYQLALSERRKKEPLSALRGAGRICIVGQGLSQVDADDSIVLCLRLPNADDSNVLLLEARPRKPDKPTAPQIPVRQAKEATGHRDPTETQRDPTETQHRLGESAKQERKKYWPLSERKTGSS